MPLQCLRIMGVDIMEDMGGRGIMEGDIMEWDTQGIIPGLIIKGIIRIISHGMGGNKTRRKSL